MFMIIRDVKSQKKLIDFTEVYVNFHAVFIVFHNRKLRKQNHPIHTMTTISASHPAADEVIKVIQEFKLISYNDIRFYQ